MNRLKLIAAAALLGLPLAACDEATPPAPTGSIGGQVAVEGKGIDGVSVNLGNGSSTTTSGGGNYRFAGVENGAYNVTISGYPSDATFDRTSAAAAISEAGQSVTLNFSGTYVRTASVLGVVAIEGVGVGGVEVALTGGPDGGNDAVTDAGGRYAFTGLRAGSYGVEISGFDNDEVGFSATAQDVAVAVGESKVVSFDGTYLRTAGISGQVSVDGVGIEGVTVSLAGGPDKSDMTVATDAGGQYAFAKLRGGEYRVGISGYDADEYEFEATSQSVTVALGETANVPFEGTLVRTAGISGRVSAGGTGLAGVTVSLTGPDSATYTTDQSGQYAFPALPAGTYALAVSGYDADEYGFDDDEKSQTVTVEDGQTAIVNFEGHLLRSGSISGRVTAGEMNLGDVTVTLSGEEADTAMTDAAGRYSFTNLPAGDYAVAVSGYDADLYGFDSDSMDVELERGKAATADFAGHLLRTGGISGRVTVGGSGMAGVTVTLSGEEADTAATNNLGQYSFANLPAGDYTVAISGYSEDEYDFGETSMTVKLARGDKKDDANFAGTALRTGSISGRVSVGDKRLQGVTVALSGAEADTAATDAEGEYSFGRLKAGDYAVTISGYDSVAYVFAKTSMDVTLAKDGTKSDADFEGQHARTASVSGRLYLDSNPMNDTLNAGSEDHYAMQGFPVSLQGPGVNDVTNGATDSTGAYAFSGLMAGTYRVVPQATDSVRSMLTRAGLAYNGAATGTTVTVAAGAVGTVHVPIDIVRQKVVLSARKGNGKDGAAATMGGPVAEVELKLYATYQNATAGTRELGTAKTDSTGMAEFDFAREDDADMFVFAKVTGMPAGYVVTSNEIQEVEYLARYRSHAESDAVTLVNTKVTLQFSTRSIMTKRGGGKGLTGWKSSYVVGKDTTAFGTSDAKGMAKLAFTTHADSMPRTYSVMLDASQTQAMGEMFDAKRMPSGMAEEGAVHLSYVHDGLNDGATVDLGSYEVKFTTQTLIVAAHWERDQTEGYTKNLLDGDRAGKAGAVSVELLYEDDRRRLRKYEIADTAEKKLGNPRLTDKNGMVTFRRLPTDVPFTVEATGRGGRKIVGGDEWDTYGAVLDGGRSVGAFGAEGGTGPVVRLCPLGMSPGGQDCSTFAYLWANNIVWGTVGSKEYGTPEPTATLSPARPLGCVPTATPTPTTTATPTPTRPPSAITLGQCYLEDEFPDVEANGLTVTLTATDTNIDKGWTMTATVGGAQRSNKSWTDSGVFRFSNVPSGEYRLTFGSNDTWLVPATQNARFHLLQKEDADSTATGHKRDVRHQRALALYRKISITGTVGNDRDNNNSLDPTETRAGIRLKLYEGEGWAVPSRRGKLVGTATTNSRGVYKFENVVENPVTGPLSGHHVAVDSTAEYTAYGFASAHPSPLPCGPNIYCTWGIAAGLFADARPARRHLSDTNPGNQPGLPRWSYTSNVGFRRPATVVNAGGTDPDFVLLFKNGKVSGRVVNDPATGADKPLANVDLWLDHCRRPLGGSGNPNPARSCTAGMFSPRQTATTDSLGNYQFTGLIEGLYKLQVALPNNFSIVSGTTAQTTWHEVKVPQQQLTVNYNLR